MREGLSEISRDIGQVLFGAMFIGPILDPKIIDWKLAISGLVTAFIFWTFSLLVVKSK